MPVLAAFILLGTTRGRQIKRKYSMHFTSEVRLGSAVVCWFCAAGTFHHAADAQTPLGEQQGLSISVRQADGQVRCFGPVGVRVTVTNESEPPIDVAFQHVNVSEFRVMSVTPAQGCMLQVEESLPKQPSSYVPVLLKPGQTAVRLYYANRQLTFTAPGVFTMKYSIWLRTKIMDRVSGKAKVTRSTYNGELQVNVVRGSDGELDEELGRIAARLSSRNWQEVCSAVEALEFLKTPLVVKYLQRMLSTDGCSATAVRALGRIENPLANEVLKSELGKRGGDVARALLEELGKKGIGVERQEILRLLSSERAPDRYAVVSYLERFGKPEHQPLLEALVHDKDESVAKAASRAIHEIRGREK